MPRRTASLPDGAYGAIPGYGGFQAVATALTEEPPGRTITRQAVYSWYKHRKANGFPEMVQAGPETAMSQGLAFSLEQVRNWYAELWARRAETGRSNTMLKARRSDTGS